MPRIRTIKPEFPQSESMGRVSRDARLAFVLMWTLADDSGRLRGNSRMLASFLFPYDDDAPTCIENWLEELESQNCIVRYIAAPDDSQYVQICNWASHQKIDKPSESRIPAPDSESIRERSRVFANDREDSIPSRARADQGPRTKEGTKDQGPRTKDQGLIGIDETSTPPARKQSSVQRDPPSADEVRRYMADQGYPDDADAFVDFYSANGWVQGRGKPIKDWRAAVRNWQRTHFAKSTAASPPVTFAQQRVTNTTRAIEDFANG